MKVFILVFSLLSVVQAHAQSQNTEQLRQLRLQQEQLITNESSPSAVESRRQFKMQEELRLYVANMNHMNALNSSDTFATDKYIYNFFPKFVHGVNDKLAGTYGKATGIGGEGGGEVDVRIVAIRGIKGRKEYRQTLCATLEAAKNNKTSVDLIVKEVTIREPEGNSHIQVVNSILLGNNLSE